MPWRCTRGKPGELPRRRPRVRDFSSPGRRRRASSCACTRPGARAPRPGPPREPWPTGARIARRTAASSRVFVATAGAGGAPDASRRNAAPRSTPSSTRVRRRSAKMKRVLEAPATGSGVLLAPAPGLRDLGGVVAQVRATGCTAGRRRAGASQSRPAARRSPPLAYRIVEGRQRARAGPARRSSCATPASRSRWSTTARAAATGTDPPGPGRPARTRRRLRRRPRSRSTPAGRVCAAGARLPLGTPR